MSEKQTKKLKAIAKMFYTAQPINLPNKQSFQEIFDNLKTIHKLKKNGNQKSYQNKA